MTNALKDKSYTIKRSVYVYVRPIVETTREPHNAGT